jgi:hypothetical protein
VTSPLPIEQVGTAKETDVTVPDMIEFSMASADTGDDGTFLAVVPAGGSNHGSIMQAFEGPAPF